MSQCNTFRLIFKKRNMDRIIFKRDQSQQKFNPQKITDAISYAMVASNEGGIDDAKKITTNVLEKLDIKKQSLMDRQICCFMVMDLMEALCLQIFPQLDLV